MTDTQQKPLYVVLARAVGAYQRCTESSANASQAGWAPRHKERIETFVKQYMPRGSGFDNGTTLDLDASSEEKLIFHTAFHHMNESGMYDGWTDHEVTVHPSLAFGLRIVIRGRDRNDIKDLIQQTFDIALNTEVTEYPERSGDVIEGQQS